MRRFATVALASALVVAAGAQGASGAAPLPEPEPLHELAFTAWATENGVGFDRLSCDATEGAGDICFVSRGFTVTAFIPAPGGTSWQALVNLATAATSVVYDISSAPSCQMHGAVRLGSTGDDVWCLQERLQQVMVEGGAITVDGSFGSATEMVVRDFQAAHGLVVDGVVGAQTAGLLGVWDPITAAPFGDALGSIEIPRIGVALPFREGIEMWVLDQGPGHWPGTPMPGQQGNVVLAGHRVSHNADFRNLDSLGPGDDVIFTTTSGRYEYDVVSVEIVSPDALWIVDQTSDATATLFACHPPGSTAQRIVVHLELRG